MEIVSFEIYLPGMKAMIIEGNKMNNEAINKIKSLTKGSIIIINASSEYRHKITSVSVTLTD
jgi:hypothetical protein